MERMTPARRRSGLPRKGPKGTIKLGTCVLKLDEPRIMGIVNATTDSFSGDGLGGDVERAVALGDRMFSDGADLVDVGGESTRPRAAAVPLDLELERTVPVVEALSNRHPGRISIDTMKPKVAEAALFAGASVVNDVLGLRAPGMIEVVAEHDAVAIIMHMQGEPRTMQVNPRYKDVVGDILDFLNERIAAAEDGGVDPKKIMVDPGIGFGKTVEHNIEIISRLREFKSLGKPIVIGVSRKVFIGRLTGAEGEDRLPGSLTAAVIAVENGANIVRVHDVPETRIALNVAHAVMTWGKG